MFGKTKVQEVKAEPQKKTIEPVRKIHTLGFFGVNRVPIISRANVIVGSQNLTELGLSDGTKTLITQDEVAKLISES